MQSAQTTDGPMTKDPLGVDVLPIIEIDAKTDMLVQIAFESTSNREFRYLEGNTPKSINRIYFAIFKDGRRVNPLRGAGAPPILDKSRVRTLRPGESVLQMEKLRDRYKKLEAGSYYTGLKEHH